MVATRKEILLLPNDDPMLVESTRMMELNSVVIYTESKQLFTFHSFGFVLGFIRRRLIDWFWHFNFNILILKSTYLIVFGTKETSQCLNLVLVGSNCLKTDVSSSVDVLYFTFLANIFLKFRIQNCWYHTNMFQKQQMQWGSKVKGPNRSIYDNQSHAV